MNLDQFLFYFYFSSIFKCCYSFHLQPCWWALYSKYTKCDFIELNILKHQQIKSSVFYKFFFLYSQRLGFFIIRNVCCCCCYSLIQLVDVFISVKPFDLFCANDFFVVVVVWLVYIVNESGNKSPFSDNNGRKNEKKKLPMFVSHSM